MTRVKWKLIGLKIVLILRQYRCTVCVECTIGSEIVLDEPDGILGDVGHVQSHFFLVGNSVNIDAI